MRKARQDKVLDIVFIEEAITNDRNPNQKYLQSIRLKNKELEEQVKIAEDLGHKSVSIISQVGLIDQDTKATVDGTHYNDLGFERHTKHLVNSISKLAIV